MSLHTQSPTTTFVSVVCRTYVTASSKFFYTTHDTVEYTTSKGGTFCPFKVFFFTFLSLSLSLSPFLLDQSLVHSFLTPQATLYSFNWPDEKNSQVSLFLSLEKQRKWEREREKERKWAKLTVHLYFYEARATLGSISKGCPVHSSFLSLSLSLHRWVCVTSQEDL